MYALSSLKYIRFGNIHLFHLPSKFIEDRKIGYILALKRS